MWIKKHPAFAQGRPGADDLEGARVYFLGPLPFGVVWPPPPHLVGYMFTSSGGTHVLPRGT